MAEKEDVIFSLKVEQGNAFSEMEKLKKSILETKQEQQELTKAYKAGNITLDEFVKEQVRMEAILKRQQSTYNNVQKSITGVKTQLDKLIDSNKKISKSFEEAAGKITIAGVNMGDLTGKIASFANPATAAVAIVGGLTAAYLKSTTGAKDLAFAQERLSYTTTRLIEGFGTLAGGGSGDRGSGLLNTLLDRSIEVFRGLTPILFVFNKQIDDFLRKTKEAAQASETLKDLEISRAFAQGDSKNAERQAELQRRIRDDETKTNKERAEAAQQINEIMQAAGDRTVTVIQAQISAIKESTVNYANNREAQLKVAQLESEIADKREEITGKLTENTAAIRNMIKAQNELDRSTQIYIDNFLKTLDKDKKATEERQERVKMAAKFMIDAKAQEVDANAAMNKAIAAQNKKAADEEQVIRSKNKDASVALARETAEAEIEAATMVLSSLGELAGQGSEIQKTAALLSISINTADAVIGGIKAAQTLGFPGNLIAMASTTAAILSAIANAKSTLGFAEGGWTGPGSKYQPAGIVHADEYVTPKHIVHSAAAQPHLAALETMRLRGYADGGLVTNSLTSGTNQNIMIANMLKMMPRPIVELTEVARGIDKLELKQRTANNRPFQR